ncbi:MAG: GNAT family N-acetyltransferase [Gammaproteobacteria bacterium]|nr:GNAT family N-acetyltransferase [Gammaproteobacteria bacterium]
MLIKGGRVRLVPFSATHLYDQAYYGWLCDREVVRFIGRTELLEGITFEEAKRYVEQLWENQYCNFFAVHESINGSFIGTAKVNFSSAEGRKHGIADVGIMIGERDWWGRGLSIDILRSVSIYSFDQLKARKLTAGAWSVNEPVIKAFLRIGFRIDGRARQQLPVDNGYCDHVLMSCFERELLR